MGITKQFTSGGPESFECFCRLVVLTEGLYPDVAVRKQKKRFRIANSYHDISVSNDSFVFMSPTSKQGMFLAFSYLSSSLEAQVEP